MCSSPDRYLSQFPTHLPLTFLCDPPLLLVYFQVNTGAWYFGIMLKISTMMMTPLVSSNLVIL